MGHAATLRFPSPLIKPDVRISRIRLSDWLHRKAHAGDLGRRLRIMFADEVRSGRGNRPRPCWAPIGIRPEVASGLIREYIYLHGAVSPKDGTCVYLIMPTSNTACFQAFLNVLSRKFVGQDILLVLDGAPNHRSSELVLPGNISALFPPPHAPELKPPPATPLSLLS